MARNEALLRMTKALLARRSELRKRLGVELDDLAPSSSQSVTGDVADAAFESSGEEVASQLVELEAKELSQVEVALIRIKQGKYGLCAGCACKIPVARLSALPYTILCVKCQSEAEDDADWLESRTEVDFNKIRDNSDDREINLADIEMDIGK